MAEALLTVAFSLGACAFAVFAGTVRAAATSCHRRVTGTTIIDHRFGYRPVALPEFPSVGRAVGRKV